MKKVLITGVTGFIGQRLAVILFESGFEVSGTTRKSTANSNYIIVENIDSSAHWNHCLKGIDCVVHLAARVHEMNDTSSDPLKEFRTVNSEGTIHLANACVEAGVKRLIYLSSIKVNGECTIDHPISELDKTDPKDFYALSKFEAEVALLGISKKSDLEVVILRPPLVYGAGVKANFHNMMKWLNKEIPLPFGAIYNKRSLIYLDNLIDLIVTCIKHPNAVNEIFLVSDGEDLSTPELLNRVSLALGKKSWLLPVNQKILEYFLMLIGKEKLAQRLCGSFQIDISKAKNLLNWTPPITVDEGLRKVAEHYLESQKLRD